jgi:hypothetical protein
MILTEKHKKFLSDEFNVNDIDSLDDDAFDTLYNKLSDIEIEEFNYKDESERGDIAVAIMDYMAEQFPPQVKCPVCGEYMFGHDNNLDDCVICGWINDGTQLRSPDLNGGANSLSLNQYRAAWEQKQALAKAQ